VGRRQDPEAWVGLQVRAGTGPGGADEITGKLEEVSDRGLVLLQEVSEEGRQVERPVFYPWASVAWVYPI
jgi:hypothetical protein